MIQPMRLITKFLSQHPPKYQFSKILKMAPLPSTQITSQKLIKSIASSIQFFNKIPFMPKSQPPKTTSSQTQTFQQFISMIADINIQTFEKAIYFKVNQFQLQEIIEQLKRLDLISNTIELLICQPEYTHRLKKFLTNFMNCVCIIFRKDILFNKAKNLELNYVKKCSNFFNEYMILVDLTDRFVINFCLFMTYIKQTNSLDASRAFFSNQKILVDYILERKDNFQISKKDISIMIGYTTSAMVGQNYPAKYNSLVQLLYSWLSPQWYSDPEYNLKKVITHFEKARFDCKKITDGLKYWIGQEITADNFGLVVSAITELIKIKAKIYYGEPIPKEYVVALKRIASYLKDIEQVKQDRNKLPTMKIPHLHQIEQVSKYLLPTLYRSSIWEQDIWMYFAEWIETQKNYQKLYVIDLFNVFQLIQIDKQVIPSPIIKRLQKTKQFLLMKHNFRIQDVDLIKSYHTQFGDRMGSHYTIQQQICNNLRSVSKKKVTAQVLVRMFIIDILINDKVIIQINGFSHYIDNQNKQKIPSLKSAFKKRLLGKLGYKLLEYEVSTIIDGNVELLKIMNADIERVLGE